MGVMVCIGEPVGEVGVGIRAEVVLPPGDCGAFFAGFSNFELITNLAVRVEVGGSEGVAIDIDDHGAEGSNGGDMNRMGVGMCDGVSISMGSGRP